MSYSGLNSREDGNSEVSVNQRIKAILKNLVTHNPYIYNIRKSTVTMFCLNRIIEHLALALYVLKVINNR